MTKMSEELDFDLDQVIDGIKKVDFHHPYTPYDVQEQFMRSVYDVLDTGNGQVGILESPTGTVGLIDWSYFVFCETTNGSRANHSPLSVPP